MPSEACSEELVTLAAIFLDDISIAEKTNGDSLLSMVLFPATADDEESRYVTLTLDILLPPEYPDTLPKITFRNPRGLSEVMLNDLEKRMNEKCVDMLGSQMAFELIDMGKEFLTANNRPASECPICLLSFTEFDVFFRSHCFHHFHAYCLGKYLQSLDVNALNLEDLMPHETLPEKSCPVCREELTEKIDVKKLLSAPPPSEENSLAVETTASLLAEWNDKRETMNKLFEKQKSQGGIIDLTEKDRKFLVISTPSSRDREQQRETESVTTAVATVPPLMPGDIPGFNGQINVSSLFGNRPFGNVGTRAIEPTHFHFRRNHNSNLPVTKAPDPVASSPNGGVTQHTSRGSGGTGDSSKGTGGNRRRYK